MKKNLILLFSIILICFNTALSSVINVPGDYLTIQQGINMSSHGDTVLVADGIYVGIGNRDIIFSGKAITLKSQNGPQYTIIDCQGDTWNPRQGFIFQIEDQNVTLDGFTIEHGSSGPFCSNTAGGAVYCEGSPVIKNCVFNSNHADPNSCGYAGGGGMFCILGSPVLINCRFENNSSFDTGGAFKAVLASPVLTNCVFVNNQSAKGAAIHSEKSRLFINHSYIYDHQGTLGILTAERSSKINITQTTFLGNQSDSSGIIVLASNDTLNIINSILWNSSYPEIDTSLISKVTISYSDISGGWQGDGNIDCDPLFCDSENGGFSVSAISCCAHAGNSGNSIGGVFQGCGALGGLVTDQGGYPIPGAAVNLFETGITVQTDSGGMYLFEVVDSNTYDVLFSHGLYRDSVVTGLSVPVDSVGLDITLAGTGPCADYVVGDVNSSGGFNGLDITFGVSFFKGGALPSLECECGQGGSWFVAGDINASCSYNGLDITYGVNYFKGGDTPNSCPDCPPQ